MKKNNKNNKKALILALFALLTVATLAFIGTMAKYMTATTATNEAVVAKFGLNVPNTIDLFKDSYTNVQADTQGKKIIAPGTQGSYDFEVTGMSEVAYKVEAEIAVVYSSLWGAYAPLEFSLNGTDWLKPEAFKTALAAALAREEMAPNESYSGEQTIHWRWPFYTNSEDDAKDSAMGQAAATGAAPKVTISVEITAVQID